MAKYWELKYHEDTTEKHEITQKELSFLKDLQKELNTQDAVGQADPKYWTIQDYAKTYGRDMNNPDGIVVYDSDACESVLEMDYSSSCDINDNVLHALKENNYDLSEENEERIESAYDLETLCEVLEDLGFSVSEYEKYPVSKGCFLTHKAADEHLRRNHYNYGKDAHTYAMTAWRSLEEPLWHILQKVDFDKLTETKN